METQSLSLWFLVAHCPPVAPNYEVIDTPWAVFTHADDSAGVRRLSASVCVFVCLSAR